jgi:hypothetical protein
MRESGHYISQGCHCEPVLIGAKEIHTEHKEEGRKKGRMKETETEGIRKRRERKGKEGRKKGRKEYFLWFSVWYLAQCLGHTKFTIDFECKDHSITRNCEDWSWKTKFILLFQTYH